MKPEQPEIYSYCTATDFRTDISQLCAHCPIKERIERAIPLQIIQQAQDQKEVLTQEQFKQYIADEIQDARQAMRKAQLIELQRTMDGPHPNDNLRQNRIEVYIWNKERIKALNAVANQIDTAANVSNIAANPSSPDRVVRVRSTQVEPVLQVLNPYFPEDQHPLLKELLQGKAITTPLTFNDNGNKLMDAFKQLFKVQAIAGITRAELQAWLIRHFTFYNNRTHQQQAFKLDTVERTISGDDRSCMNPILKANIVDGQISITPIPIKQKKIRRI